MRIVAEQPPTSARAAKAVAIWSHWRSKRRYPEQFLLIFTSLSKGSEGSRRPPGGGRQTSPIQPALEDRGLSIELDSRDKDRVVLDQRDNRATSRIWYRDDRGL